ncbi:hypothetical protein CMO83_01005 [Candidatus Woesearchaeota archaeon]|jgi:hypothetical protein|nr:hypothetical protein [Candidatus Woesearchaeota archaeon]MDP6648444.1 hypothetical protein [Candidatus Woesearchaeota archaeon]|tara:strand:+ start:46369 stop:46884 length:516 start_codon:yes stop_codon:yes gene_type:complete
MIRDYELLPSKSPNGKAQVKCKECNEIKDHHARGYCYRCYKRVGWKRKKILCSNCNRRRHHKAFGLCGGCHVRLHHYEKTLARNAKRYHGIDYQLYKKTTEKCNSCGFSKIVQIHHLDGNTRNNDLKNIVGLCPNCHKLIHMYEYYEEIKNNLEKKGYDVSKVHPTNYVKS